MSKQNTTERTRNYASILYEESATENWIDILTDTHVQFLISPLHDMDINPTGEPKKPHRHIIVMFDGVKTKKQAKDVFDMIGGVGVEAVRSLRGYVRYLCHLDNPEKAQYSQDHIIALNGAPYEDIVGTDEDDINTLKDVIRYIMDNDIDNLADLVNMSLDNNRQFKIIRNNAHFIDGYIKSRTWKQDQIRGRKYSK